MRKKAKTSLKFPKLFALAVVISAVSFTQLNSLRGQLFQGPITVISPVGEAVKIDISGGYMSPTAKINVSWSTSMTRQGYSIIVKELLTGKLVRQISVSFSSLPDKGRPSYQLPVTGLIPYREYTVSVASLDSLITTRSAASTFWIAVKDMPSYEQQMPEVYAPVGEIPYTEAVATWSALDVRTRKYYVELSEPSSLNSYTVTTKSLSDIGSPSLFLPSKITLKENVRYQYRVMGEDMYGKKSQWSNFGSFTINNNATFESAKPTLISPSGIQHYFDKTFRWNPIKGTYYYRVEIRGTNNSVSYSLIVRADNLLDKNSPLVVVSNFPVNDQNTYVWYVTAYSIDEKSSQTSDMIPFSVVLDSFKDKKPVAVGPTGIVKKEDVKFSWNKLEYAVAYNVSISVGSQTYLKRVNASDYGDPDVYAVSFSDVNITDDTDYSFTVVAFDSTYVNSQPSNRIQFRTSANDFVNLVPETVAPKGTIASFDGELHWLPVSGAWDYRVSAMSLNSAVPFGYSAYVSVSSLSDPANPSWLVPNIPLDAGTYSFTIQARNPQGYHSKVSQETFFQTKLADTPSVLGVKPVVTGPLSGSSETSPIAWDPVPGATSYGIWINSLTDGKDTTVYNKSIPLTEINDPTAPSFSPGVFAKGGNYNIWVRAEKQGSSVVGKELSQWSRAFAFVAAVGAHGSNADGKLSSTKPVVMVPVSPTDSSPVISWQPVPGAGSYILYITNATKNKIEKVVALDDTTSSYVPEYPLIAGHKYNVWVRAVGGGYFSPWSQAATFTVGSSGNLTSSSSLPFVTMPK